MKILKLSQLGLFLITTSFLSNLAHAQDYYMVCRGGPGMSAEIRYLAYDGDYNEFEMRVIGKFKLGKTAGNPLAGECVWRLSAMAGGGPSEFQWLTSVKYQSFGINHTGIFSGPGPALPIIYGIRNQQLFYLRAKVSGSVLFITKLGWD